MLGHNKHGLYLRVYLATCTEDAVNQIMIGAPNNGSSVADLGNICKPTINNIVEKTYIQ